MCRIFGFRSVLKSQVHHSLVSADNALSAQSLKHPDGWGVAYYVDQAPHVIKSETKAMDDQLFKRVSGIVTSNTVIAHIRKATLGKNHLLNTHPFQYGKWTFVHNGNIKNFEQDRKKYESLIKPEFRRFLLGETDSERIFYILLSQLKDHINVSKIQALEAIKQAVQSLLEISGPVHPTDAGPPDETYLSFLLSDGENMFAFNGGKTLFYSTYKKHCPERDTCPFFNNTCENEKLTGSVNHLIVSSESLSGENIWSKLELGEIIGVDKSMNVFKHQLLADL